MNARYGRPTAAELVAAVADFLDHDVRAALSGGHLNFHARVAANALRMVQRELLADGDAADVALAGLGVADEVELAAGIRRGDYDGRTAELTSCLRALISLRLAAAHPGYERED